MKSDDPPSYEYVYVTISSDHPHRLGVNHELIREIVDAFYEKVRDDRNLGPVFESKLDGHWPAHLRKMYDFWSTVIFGEMRYSGDPVKAHVEVAAIVPEHFEPWLELFEQTLKERCRSQEQIDLFLLPAKRMARVFATRINASSSGGSPILN